MLEADGGVRMSCAGARTDVCENVVIRWGVVGTVRCDEDIPVMGAGLRSRDICRNTGVSCREGDCVIGVCVRARAIA